MAQPTKPPTEQPAVHDHPQPGMEAAHSDPEQSDAYPRPRVRLAMNWVQPKRPYDHKKDYHNLPRFRPDYGREPRQFAKRVR